MSAGGSKKEKSKKSNTGGGDGPGSAEAQHRRGVRSPGTWVTLLSLSVPLRVTNLVTSNLLGKKSRGSMGACPNTTRTERREQIVGGN